MKILDFPGLVQTYEYDCGAKALQLVLSYYGIDILEGELLKEAKTNSKNGTLKKDILKTLKNYNLKYKSKRMSIKEIEGYIEKKIPVIVLLQAWSMKKLDYKKSYENGHWVIVIGYKKEELIFKDPYSFNNVFLEKKEFLERWHGKENNKKILNLGIAVYGKKIKYDSNNIIHMN